MQSVRRLLDYTNCSELMGGGTVLRTQSTTAFEVLKVDYTSINWLVYYHEQVYISMGSLLSKAMLEHVVDMQHQADSQLQEETPNHLI